MLFGRTAHREEPFSKILGRRKIEVSYASKTTFLRIRRTFPERPSDLKERLTPVKENERKPNAQTNTMLFLFHNTAFQQFLIIRAIHNQCHGASPFYETAVP